MKRCYLKLKAKNIIDTMNKWAKPSLIDTWDNTGFQIGNEEKQINKILISLDLDNNVLEKAINKAYDMIITHHPLIFQPMKSITTGGYKEKLVYDLIRNDIIVYNAHTNLDQVENGVSHELGKILGLRDTEVLHYTDPDEKYGYGLVGNIGEIDLIEYLKVIKLSLGIKDLIVYGDIKRTINRLAVCGGAGADFIYDAYKSGAHVYVTGDIKYHDGQLADEYGLTIIDPSHYHTEKIILPVIRDYLKENFSNLVIDIWDKPSPAYGIY